MSLQNERHDYNNDPYFYTAPNYRYNRGGRYYETNRIRCKFASEGHELRL